MTAPPALTRLVPGCVMLRGRETKAVSCEDLRHEQHSRHTQHRLTFDIESEPYFL